MSFRWRIWAFLQCVYNKVRMFNIAIKSGKLRNYDTTKRPLIQNIALFANMGSRESKVHYSSLEKHNRKSKDC